MFEPEREIRGDMRVVFKYVKGLQAEDKLNLLCVALKYKVKEVYFGSIEERTFQKFELLNRKMGCLRKA